MRARAVPIVVLAVLASACAESMPKPPLTRDAVDLLRSAGDLQIVRATGSGLAVHSPAAAWLTLIPVVGGEVYATVTARRAREWITTYDIEDPAWSVKQILASVLPARLGLPVRNIEFRMRSPAPDALRETFGTGHVLVLWTAQWKMAKSTATNFDVALSYRVGSRLVRISDAAVLWEGECDVQTARAPIGKWGENDGTLLKSEHTRAAHACSSQLIGRLVAPGL
jgi:hypothetical protein